MGISRRTLFATGLGATLGANLSTASAAQPEETDLLVDLDRMPDFSIDLWPDGAPGGDNVTITEHIVERKNPYNLRDRALVETTRPRLEVFKPKNSDGSIVLVIPGGGYKLEVIDKEGYETARWFSRRGVTVYVLMHRMPHHGWAAGPDTPLQDAQRAVRVIRARSEKDNVDPSKLMVIGFSAGGHLAGSLATRFDAVVYNPVDDADDLSARPDLAALTYPVATMKSDHAHGGSRRNLIGENPSDDLVLKYSLETAPPENSPPVFLLHASDDKSVPVENSTQLYAALRQANVPCALHVFTSGGHGFGMRGINDSPLRRWPAMIADWAAEIRESRAG